VAKTCIKVIVVKKSCYNPNHIVSCHEKQKWTECPSKIMCWKRKTINELHRVSATILGAHDASRGSRSAVRVHRPFHRLTYELPPVAMAATPLEAARPSLVETEVSSTTSKRLTFCFHSIPLVAGGERWWVVLVSWGGRAWGGQGRQTLPLFCKWWSWVVGVADRGATRRWVWKPVGWWCGREGRERGEAGGAGRNGGGGATQRWAP
jgi:hypothetical protein